MKKTIIFENTNDKFILHPITLKIIKNEPDKHLVLPYGDSNVLNDQKNFINKIDNVIIEKNYEKIFFSDDYFFKAIFNVNTFEEKINIIDLLINKNNHVNTIEYILECFKNTVDKISDNKLQLLINLYIKIYSFYHNKQLTYQESYELIKQEYIIITK